MTRIHLKYKIYAERSIWSNRWIWQAVTPGEITGRPFDTWAQAAHYLTRAHEQKREVRVHYSPVFGWRAS